MPDPVLVLRDFGVRFGERIILAGVSFEVPATGPFTLFGPAGTGKSTLLRSLAGLNDANPAFSSWGTAIHDGRGLGDGERPALIRQSARLLMSTVADNVVTHHPDNRRLSPAERRQLAADLCRENGFSRLSGRLDEAVVDLPTVEQRMVALARVVAGDPALVCMDEPTSDISEAEADLLIEHILATARSRAVLAVLHNQEHARRLGGQCALMAGGRVIEQGATGDFLSEPRTESGQTFVRTGTCHVPAPDADPRELAPEAPAPEPLPAVATPAIPGNLRGPPGFLWLEPGRLGGAPLPGAFHALETDLAALRRIGVTTLVSLTREPPDPEVVEAHGLVLEHSPIPDMAAPGLTQAWALCRRLGEALEGGEVVTVHCRAGRGRTGTLLACYDIWRGQDPVAALERVRNIHPGWIQSEEQVAFLQRFSGLLERQQKHGS